MGGLALNEICEAFDCPDKPEKRVPGFYIRKVNEGSYLLQTLTNVDVCDFHFEAKPLISFKIVSGHSISLYTVFTSGKDKVFVVFSSINVKKESYSNLPSNLVTRLSRL